MYIYSQYADIALIFLDEAALLCFILGPVAAWSHLNISDNVARESCH